MYELKKKNLHRYADRIHLLDVMWEHYNDTVCVITPIFRTNTLNSKTNALTLHSRSQHTPVAVPGSPLFCHCISSSQCVPILHREEHTSSVTFCVHVRCYSTILLLFLFLFCSHFFSVW